MSGIRYPETKVLLQFASMIQDTMAEPSAFATRLYSEEIIDRRVYRRITDHSGRQDNVDRAVDIVQSVEAKLEAASNEEDRVRIFKLVLGTMDSQIPLDSVAEDMRTRYEEVKKTWVAPKAPSSESSPGSMSKLSGKDTSIKLDLAELLNELVDVTDKWRPFGVQLRISTSKLNVIGKNNSSEEERFSAVLEYWMDNPSEKAPLTWETIVMALESPNVEKGALAKKIRKEYL